MTASSATQSCQLLCPPSITTRSAFSIGRASSTLWASRKAAPPVYNIEFTAGDPADNNAKFFFNGAYDTLKPFIDSGVLFVSGQTKFEEVATASWDTTTAMNHMQSILASSTIRDKLDVALCSNDSTALGVNAQVSSPTILRNQPAHHHRSGRR